MLIYYVIFLILSLSAFMTGKKRNLAILGFTIYSILYVFEARVGMDYEAYQSFYNSMNGIGDLSAGGYEIGYNLLALLFHKIGLPFQFFHICFFATIDFLFFKATRKLNLELGITALLALYYVFYPSLEAMRQWIATSLFLYSLTFILPNSHEANTDDMKFFILNFIGFLFHRTAILAFIFYFFRKNKSLRIGIVCALIFFAALQPFILNYLQRFPLFYNRYYYYVWSRSIETESTSSISIKLLEYTFSFAVLLFICFKDNYRIAISEGRIKIIGKKKKQNQSIIQYIYYQFIDSGNRLSLVENISLHLVGLGLIIQVFITPILGSVYRLVYYCDLGIIMFYAAIYHRIRNAGMKCLYILFLIFYVGFRLWRVFPFDNEHFIYHFLF